MRRVIALFSVLVLVTTTYATVLKTVNMTTAGSLSTLLETSEKTAITNLTLIGTIDARDFKTMREEMPLLEVIDLSETTIAAYSGTEGTNYGANTIPSFAFDECWTICSITIPSNVDTIGYSSISDCENLESFIIPENSTLKVVSDYAFEDCERLKSIFIPNTLTYIGAEAFSDCDSLGSFVIPAAVTSIGSFAFAGCGALISVNASNPKYSSLDGILYDKQKTTLIQCPISKSGVLTIPESVRTLGSAAFNDCENLSAVTIPRAVTTISSEAFYGCSGLTSMNMSDYVTTISSSAFAGCSGLTSITIPSKVTYIGEYAFSGCSGLTSIIIPTSVTSIGVNAFYYCSGLTTLNYNAINGSVIYSGIQSVFDNCANLITLNIGSQVTTLPSYIFRNCQSLTGALVIPSSVKTIGSNTFYGCSGLTSITIPTSVTSIYGYAFYNCSGLKSVIAKAKTPANLGTANNVFEGIDKTSCVLYVPKNAKSAYASKAQWKDFSNTEEFSSLSVSVQTIGLTAEAGSTASFDVVSDSIWTVSSNQDWLTTNPVSGSNTAAVTLTASANTTTETRSATITISGINTTPQTIVVTQSAATPNSLSSKTTASDIVLWPNPVTDKLNVSGIEDPAILQFFTLNGQLLLSKKIAPGEVISTDAFTQGVYVVRISTTDEIVIKKLIKK
jgi:hypothetical protein